MTSLVRMTPGSWDVHAREYAAMPFRGPRLQIGVSVMKAVSSLLPLSSATLLLDAGAGSGAMIEILSSHPFGPELSPTARIIASDFSTEMVSIIKEKKAAHVAAQKEGKSSAQGSTEAEGDEYGIWERLESEVYDIQDFHGVKDNTVSHLTGCLVYFAVTEPSKSMVEAYRVLAPGGAFAISAFATIEWMDLLHDAACIIRPDGTVPPFSTFLLPEFRSAASLRKLFEENGFKDVSIEEMDSNMPVKDPAQFVTAFLGGSNPGVAMVLKGFSDEEKKRVGEEWVRMVGESGKEVLVGKVLIAAGRK